VFFDVSHLADSESKVRFCQKNLDRRQTKLSCLVVPDFMTTMFQESIHNSLGHGKSSRPRMVKLLYYAVHWIRRDLPPVSLKCHGLGPNASPFGFGTELAIG